MPQYDVHDSPEAGPLLLDCQSDYFAPLDVRLVVPLLERQPWFAPGLTPMLEVSGQALMMATPLAASIPKATLGRVVGSLLHEADAITAAFDMLLGTR